MRRRAKGAVLARAGLTVERVVEAAADLADEVGFDRVTVSAVARGFGVKDASLYSHIRSLQDLRERVAVRSAGELADRVGAALMGCSGRDALMAFADAYRTFALTHPGRYQAQQLAVAPERWAELGGDLRGIEATYALLRGYGLSEPAVTDAARLLRSAFHGFVLVESHGGFLAARSPAQSWPEVVDALHRALSTWPAGA